MQDAWIVCEESCGTMHSMQGHACRERSGSVCNYEEDPVSNDDEDEGVPEGTREPEGLFQPRSRA